ncbi:MAG: prepilin-type N-terminal cleavage/methylation domain-containing protein [Lentimonas sp.]|jgi:prepilin-type N-terminal cleavage/methylation domain-containing protein
MKHLKFDRRFLAQRAFTLIEIMVATVIMVILVGFFIQITSEVLKVWNRSSGKLSANAEARVAMELLTQDLETAVVRNNGQQWIRVEAPKETGESGGSLYSNQTVALRLFSPALDRPEETLAGVAVSGGDICAIGYRLAYKESYTNGPSVYALYRRVVDPKTTFDDFLGTASQAASPQLELTSSTLWADFSGGGAAYGDITDPENYLAGNIVEFKILVYEQPETGAATDPVNANPATLVLNQKDYAYGGDTNGDGSADVMGAPLMYVDIILKILSDEGLKLLQVIEAQGASAAGYSVSDANAIKEVVLQHSEVFIRRVDLPARSL